MTLPEEMLSLQIRLEFPNDECLVPMHMRVTPSDRDSFMVANWVPSQGDLSLVLPPGPVKVEVRGDPYENEVAEVDLVGNNVSLDLEMRLRR